MAPCQPPTGKPVASLGTVPAPVPLQGPSTSSLNTAAMVTWGTTCTAISTPSCSAALTSAARPAPSCTATPCQPASPCPGTRRQAGELSLWGALRSHHPLPPCPGQDAEARAGRVAPEPELFHKPVLAWDLAAPGEGITIRVMIMVGSAASD